MNALRPLVVELVGPAGAGKSELLKSLAGRDPSIRVNMGVWTIPGPLLVLGALQVGTTTLGLFRASHAFLWEEAKCLIKLRALHHQLQLHRCTGYRTVVYEEGPVFALGSLHTSANQTAIKDGLASWWPGALQQWARALDIVVSLDASNPILARRIRARWYEHPVKGKSDAEIFAYLEQYRGAYARVVSELQARHGPVVLSFRTDQGSTAQIAEQLLTAFDSKRRAH